MKGDAPTWKQLLREHIARRGLRLTQQREAIAEIFFRHEGHANIEELYEEVRRVHPSIGHATVYRTIKLLAECGLADARQFGDGTTRYEPSIGQGHHDHLICTACGTILEFEDPRIEALQEDVCRQHGFQMTFHKMELYGLCRDCQAQQEA